MRESLSRREISPSEIEAAIARSLTELVEPGRTFSKDQVTVIRGPSAEYGLQADSFIIKKVVPRCDGEVLFRWNVSVEAEINKSAEVAVPIVKQVKFVSIDPSGFISLTGPSDPMRVLYDTLIDRNLQRRLK